MKKLEKHLNERPKELPDILERWKELKPELKIKEFPGFLPDYLFSFFP
ncbi:hypothetical protein [Methanosarcina sp. 1.H.A.2.2]|nr:hypothetical protein [Methanosarcina sp. 1.H.A.2.2]